MIKEEFAEKIQKLSKEIGILLNEKQINQFFDYMNFLLEWNEKINLTAITKPDEIILKHFVDSITIEKYIAKNTKIVDVGTGAGFPGLPLKIIREDIEVVLLDSLQKRVNFLQETIKKLGLTKIEAIHLRAEEFSRNKEQRESFDYATSRAVANLTTLSEYLIPLVKINGKCICMKGSEINEELEQSKKAVSVLGGVIESVDNFLLPESDITRNIIIIKKESKTPNKYPRKAGMPAKEPLK